MRFISRRLAQQNHVASTHLRLNYAKPDAAYLFTPIIAQRRSSGR